MNTPERLWDQYHRTRAGIFDAHDKFIKVVRAAQQEAFNEGRLSEISHCKADKEQAAQHKELDALGIPQYDEKQHPFTALDRLRLLVGAYKDRLGDADDRADEADRHYRYLMTIIGGALQGVVVPRKEDEPEVNALLEAIRKALSPTIVDVDFEVAPIEGAWWMVFNPYPRGRKPEIRHPSKEVAIEEAKRLAAKEGNKFHVLEKVWTAQPPPKPEPKKDPVWCDHIKWGQYWSMGDFGWKKGWKIQFNGVELAVPDDWVHCPVNHCNAERPF